MPVLFPCPLPDVVIRVRLAGILQYPLSAVPLAFVLGRYALWWATVFPVLAEVRRCSPEGR